MDAIARIQLALLFVVATQLSLPVNADVMPDQATIDAIKKDWRCQWCPTDAQQHKQVEVGAGYLSNDSYQYGDFSGIDSKGGYLLLNANYAASGYQGRRVQVDAEDVGLDSRSLTIEMENASLAGGVGYYAIPHLLSDTARTPYLGAEVQSLPAGWASATTPSGMTTLRASLHDEALHQQRNQFQLSLQSKRQQGRQYRFQFQQQIKHGRKSTGVAVGSTFGSAKSVLAAQPIDNVTRQGEVSALFDTLRWKLQLAYGFSQFDNHYDSLRLQYAYSAPNISEAQIGMEPDNQMQRISLSAQYQDNPDYQTNLSVALAQASQSQAYLPYSLNSNAYPTNHDLQGRIDFIDASVRQLMRLSERLQLVLQYSDNEQDNRSERAQYAYEIADSTNFASPPRANTPFGFRRQIAGAEWDYQLLPGRQSLSAVYQFKQIDRTYQSVSRTRDSELTARYKAAYAEHWRFRGLVARSQRRGSEYTALDIPQQENTLMRDFYLANRDVNRVKMVWGYVYRSLTLGLQSELRNTDFDAELGVNDMQSRFHAFTLAFSIMPRLTVNASVDDTVTRSQQSGRENAATTNWRYDFHNHDQQARIGLRYLPRRTGLRYSLLWSWLNSRLRSDSILASTSSEFPDATLWRQTVELAADYDIDSQSQLRAFYRYQKFQQDDWQRDGLALDELSNVLTLGEISPVYDVGFFALSYRRIW